MSAVSEEAVSHIDSVDVANSLVESESKCELTCDSGLDTLDSCSLSLVNTSETPKQLQNEEKEGEKGSTNRDAENDSSDTIYSPTSLSPEAGEEHHFMNFDDLHGVDDVDNIAINQLINIENKYDNEIDKISADNGNFKVDLPLDNISSDFSSYLCSDTSGNSARSESEVKNIENIENDGFGKSDIHSNGSTSIHSLDKVHDSNDYIAANDNEMKPQKIMHTLATSTMSLHEETEPAIEAALAKSTFSKSAENIPVLVPHVVSNQNSSTKELDTEQILSDFTSQKTKAQAVQKIVPDVVSTADNKYHRIPKELLNQDLGSIVKNVHGIFSSVSGSLKNAYNISSRAAHPKPPQKIASKTGSKIMSEIFEEESSLQDSGSGTDKDTISETEISKSSNSEQDSESECDAKREVYKLQVESLERLLAEQRKEMAALRERVRQQTEEMIGKEQTFKDLEGKMDLMRKRVEHAEKEKDSAVMRYASSECTVIEARRAAEAAARAERAAAAELELMGGKLKSAHAEKQRICQMYDDKCHEVLSAERELGRAREELRELEGRLKWTQSKLRTEVDAYKESAERAEKLSQQVAELEAARDAAAAHAADSLKARQLEIDLKESQAALILCRHEKAELEKAVVSLTQQLETCKSERDDATTRLATATAEVSRLQDSNLRLEEEAASLAALRARAARADALSSQLERETRRAEQAEEALSAERARAETCLLREASALQHAAQLTAQHVAAAASSCDSRRQAQALEADNVSLRAQLAALQAELAAARRAGADEAERRQRENRTMARKIAELTEEVAETNKKLEWEKGENGVLKKKHASAIKELNRELQRALRRCDQLGAKIPHAENGDHTTGSISSLSSGDSALPTEERLQNGHGNDVPDIQVHTADRMQLIERIVSLQRAAARRAERQDFLEEHARQLTDELRKKARLLRTLLSQAPAGALAGSEREQHKKRKLTKKDIARLGGGAMAAVWGGDPAGMTLELSLEMNNRLQAVLEDALLKNITLKENMDTLGKEIARLKGQPPPQASK
ncbi:coiled-coil domain-containing protein 186 isoform X2 [Plutella xylostella]|uniref:coiled-coil domain-containing protein 186 isoform X2 n=1 Tax=Plutella xylostella TaxID=51655 RepID=UPI002032DC65|nr:coiled-coil domain-containing protein 186 isoform X2 [Plutella xylostella]